jgi:hypothetical protein
MDRVGSPAILGSFVAIERRGGSEDPWLCVSDFGQVCPYRWKDYGRSGKPVNSGKYVKVRYGSVAVVHQFTSPGAAYGGIADTQRLIYRRLRFERH